MAYIRGCDAYAITLREGTSTVQTLLLIMEQHRLIFEDFQLNNINSPLIINSAEIK